MKNILTLLFILSLLFSTGLYSQNKAENDSVFLSVDKMPEFKGGTDMLMLYLQKNLKYPKKLNNSITARVIVKFVINKDGSVDKAEIMKSAHPLLDKEALRVVRKMPRWEPGEIEGKPVSVYFTLPILFHQAN